MSKTLIIAEKPSVARDIAQALGGFKREGDFYESEHYVLSSSVGHLLTLANPDDVSRGKWSFTNLPAIPKKHFDIVPTDKKSQARLNMLTKLIKRRDVDALINACDAGREGELIFRYIVQYSGTKKPIQRLWLQSMTRSAIVDAFSKLRPDADMKPLEDAARSRAEADWLIGINGTRAMTAFNSKDGGFYKTPVGRVQTPTLAIVFAREEQIRAHKERTYWEVYANFACANGFYEGRWFNPNHKKNNEDPDDRDHRIWLKETAELIQSKCHRKTGVVTEESKPSSQQSPLLFDLTSLQREANSRFGFTAKTTLALAQALYEKHKVLTYPRTDSRYLPEDYLSQVKQTLQTITESTTSINRPHVPFASKILQHNWVVPNRRVFNDKKVSDHFAIIPTLQMPKELSDAEAKIYDLVLKRFLAVFFPAAQFNLTTRITNIEGQLFKTEGKVLVSPGWLEVYGRQHTEEDALVPIEHNEKVSAEDIYIKEAQTRPPARYNEATLLSAMEAAGKLVEDDELREAMSERGLGTPATRATIIEGLLNEQYLHREGRDLVPTAKARQLMTLLNGLKVTELTSPELTGEWEHKLKQMEQGQLERQSFMQDITRVTQVLVKRAKEYELDTIPGDYVTLSTPCPMCHGVVRENYRRYACDNCDFSITKHPGGRTFETDEVETLLKNRELGPLNGFISKMGRPFSALLKITSDGKLEFDFGQDSEEDDEKIDFASLTPTICPVSQAEIYDTGMQYIIKHPPASLALKEEELKLSKIILQQELSTDQVVKLLDEGKTDLLENFVSNRTHRKFKAYLVLNKGGKVGFEFEEKTPKTPRQKKK
ncbi:DNA topoisomerase III [Basilea psittacipulmonis]|uniref:DNA topoisomerase n=1 Tax=Basilea psittacipulmonis DSM 24701 TaxID=1072685 RepID=A0A077DGT8_9BURK|nr:DNA topoisomerase III [Basilea psittacipulmonis]AIL33351.1 DNA topoisomerase III [Basilea psittacipulmonis DSM 24701]